MKDFCNLAKSSIKVNGREFSLMKQGHNIVVVNARTGRLYKRRSFASHRAVNSGRQLGRFLQGLGPDIIIVIAVQVGGLFSS